MIRRRFLAAGAIGLAAWAWGGSPDVAGGPIDPRFPEVVTVTMDSRAVRLALTGTATRTKYRLRVYAVASYAPDLALIGDWDPDLFFVVEWPSWEAFQRLPADSGYQAVAPLRECGLRRSLLLRCRAVGVALPE